MKLFRNLRFITGRWPPSFLFNKNKLSKNSPVLISPVELHLSSTFTLFLNLFVTFLLGSPLLIGEDQTEMGFGRKEFWNPALWTKYSYLELIFPKILVFLWQEPVSLWQGKGFWPKDVLLTCLHPEVVDCWGKVMLLFLPWCLCFCGIVLTKNACGTGLPTPLPFDDAGGHPSKGRVIPAECCLCWFGLFTQKFLVFLLGCKVSTPILSEVLPKLLFMALREDASFLF